MAVTDAASPAAIELATADASRRSGTTIRRQQTFWIALVSGLLLFAAFPPLNLWVLAWVAPIGWCWLIQKSELNGHRPYLQIYLAGAIHWLLTIHWVRLPHWSAYFGWVALAFYLAAYLPLLVALSRQLVHRWRWPLCFAAPVVWCGLECVRSYFLTGFCMALLGHSQVAWTQLVQIADLAGAYLVGLLVMGFAAAVAQVACAPGRRLRNFWPVAMSVASIVAALAYGHQRMNSFSSANSSSDQEIQVALIQGSRDTTFTPSDDPAVTLREYRQLTDQAIHQDPDIDLIVWPESMHTVPWVEHQSPGQVPADFPGDASLFDERMLAFVPFSRHEAGWFSRRFDKPALVGCGASESGPFPLRRYNCALWINEQGDVVGRYNKMHPVMFGEYIPFGKTFPWLYRLTPMGNGLEAGTQSVAVEVDGVRLSPCICFENTVPHLVRRQVKQLASQGQSPDALVTVTNDGWFWGSSQLDLHLTCGVFRAIEMRRPMLIAANTGFSAWIDTVGRVRKKGPRRATGFLVANVAQRTEINSLYLLTGDWLAYLCAAACLWACFTLFFVGRKAEAQS